MATDDKYIKGKDKREILKDLGNTAAPGSPVHEQQKMAIYVGCAEDLENVISGLKRRIGYLDILLLVASFIGAIATGLVAYKTFYPI